MSIVTYIGLNFEVACSDEFSDAPIEVRYFFSDEENRLSIKETHFTTPFVYEIYESGEPIWYMSEHNQQYSPHKFEEAKKTFVQLCEFLNELLPEGDYCELFICWLDDENEPTEYKMSINLKSPVIEPLKHYEKCYIKLFK